MFNSSFYFIAAYIFVLPIIGLIARAYSKETSLKDYYLAGGAVSLLPLVFTLYATQYSGNTLLGFAGNAYRNGAVVLFSVLGMMMVVVVWSLFARKLQKLSKEQGFITIIDYLRFRFNLPALANLANFILIITLCNYVLTNFKAIGLLVESITNGGVPLVWGVFIAAIAMAFYESVGGMRSVIFTDILQGSLLLAGCLLVFTVILVTFDGPFHLITQLQNAPESHWQEMDASRWRQGLSIVFLFGFAISLYPHAIQRIYAARDWLSLKKSFIFMFFLPLFTTLPIVITAMASFLLLPDIPREQSDQIIPHVLNELASNFPAMTYLLALFMAAAIAAIMSTIDSALLSIGSAITNDICKPLMPRSSQVQLTRIGKYLSWVLMLLMAWLATLLPQTIWGLLVLKLEILVQVAPAIILGIRTSHIRGQPILLGLIAGTSAAIWFKLGFWGTPDLYNISPGLWGLGINFCTIALAQSLNIGQPKTQTQRGG